MAPTTKTKAPVARKAVTPVKARTPSAPKRPTARTTKRTATTVAAKADETADNVRASVDEMVVQADLAAMDARDQWNRLMTDMDRRRAAVELAMRRLASGGAEAGRTMNDAVREAMSELREAVDGALAALR